MNSTTSKADSVLAYNEDAYKRLGFAAQRKYPNEELCRFMGRNYFGIAPEKRKSVRILELGCGSGSNLWMIAKEGFDAYGIDISASALQLAREMLTRYGVGASLHVADMTRLPYRESHFDCVLDVFSSYCLDQKGLRQLFSEVSRILRPGGRLFIYTPGKGSDGWKEPAPAVRIDQSTLDSISRPTSAYFPSPYKFRFIDRDELGHELALSNMHLEYSETVSRTYRGGDEYFEFIVAEASRNDHLDLI